MAEKKINMEEKDMFDGKKVKIVGLNVEPGKPTEPGHWRDRFPTRKEMLKYLNTSERYWSKDGGFGSEKRKTPA